ncbi:MAG: hypothetical protein COW47_01245 [Candidatus Huberarchaeum crystalense]|uniref:Uncharacterized protein n=1 Tax=Huberarchaeum crystalense TaxID=2014257 RepID=A0A2G9LIP4_HUBC1|nr:hypothetical protein [archaeon]OIP20837.1 MAG: hypothetical protein AUJ91_00105 [archaeon CG2_30_31_98]PIN66416.1 MAG: hypothetical protein COW69_02470 [Candidatus Huberarchaeum crystalense]NCS98212.1 hypothetical protein [archaeon]PIV13562.1 MAG: hypothetical protein COS45_02320 [Candidatus Huberarchaeum crystalense]
MKKKIQNTHYELRDFVIRGKTIFRVLLFLIASTLFTLSIISYIQARFSLFFTNEGIEGIFLFFGLLGFVLFICGGILMGKFKN